MNAHTKLLTKLLNLLEERLKHTKIWHVSQPTAAAFNSTLPFCTDTMSLEQWLRYVFIQRMRALVDAGKSLPTCCAITEHLEMVLTHSEKNQIMEVTLAIDQLLTKQKLPPIRLLKQ